jgi:small subunit ribosomal protein S15Ae
MHSAGAAMYAIHFDVQPTSLSPLLCCPVRLLLQFVDDHRGGKIVVELNGRLNKCGVISPRYDISHHDVEAWVARLLPSRQFGVIVLTTSSGIMDHEEARRKGVGGKVLGFFY